MRHDSPPRWSTWFSTRHLATVIVLLLGVIYSAWLVKVTTVPNQHIQYTDKVPDYFLTDVTALAFNAEGHLLHQLQSPRLLHIPANDTILLRAPHLMIYSDNIPPQGPWQITALHGKTNQDNQYIWLWNQVVLHQLPSPQNKDITILTDRMAVNANTRIAETHTPVTVLEPGLQVHSIGMRVFLDEQRVDLLSHAQGIYDVNIAGDSTP